MAGSVPVNPYQNPLWVGLEIVYDALILSVGRRLQVLKVGCILADAHEFTYPFESVRSAGISTNGTDGDKAA